MSTPQADRTETVEVPIDLAVLRSLLEQNITLAEFMDAAATLAQRNPELAVAALCRRLAFGEQPCLWVPLPNADATLDAMVMLADLVPGAPAEYLANALAWAVLFAATDAVPVGHA